MGEALGIIVVLVCGAGLMYLYLQATDRLRKVDYEQELATKVKELKTVERAYLDTLEAQRRKEEEEEHTWKPKENVVSDEKLTALLANKLNELLPGYKANG